MNDDFEKYKLLWEEVKYNHDRWDVMLRTLLTIHGFIIAAIAMLYNKDKAVYLICVLSGVGIAICALGYFALRRIDYDSQLRFYQLREYEKEMNGDSTNKNASDTKTWKHIFTYGKDFFEGILTDDDYKEIFNYEIGDKKRSSYYKKIRKGRYSKFALYINIILGIFYGIVAFILLHPLLFKQLPQLHGCCIF